MPNPPSLAGSAGKQISFAPSLKTQEELLKNAAKQGYYYPALALKQLASLSSGFIGKHNVMIPNVNDSRAHTLQMVHVYLPGIKATVERRANDQYVVTDLVLSEGYLSIGKDNLKPGVYEISRLGEDYSGKYKTNGRIKAQDGRLVAICDGGYTDLKTAASDAAGILQEVAGIVGAQGEFDLIYSGLGEGNELGKRSYDPLAITESFAVASLTARAMIDAKEKKAVTWVSMHGGSAVLTQAMSIVARQNISLKNHLVKMYHPQTDPNPALRFVQQLGMKMDKEFAQSGGRRALRVSASNLLGNARRARDKGDHYDFKDYGKDLAKGGMLGAGVASTALLVATLPGTSGGVAIAAAATSGVGAVQLLWTLAKNLLSKPKSK